VFKLQSHNETIAITARKTITAVFCNNATEAFQCSVLIQWNKLACLQCF